MSTSNNEIIINSTIGNTWIVLTKNQIIDNIFIERPDYQRTVGNIYMGKVQNVIPGMNLEFIALYWHFVDIVWIVLFTVVYLI